MAQSRHKLGQWGETQAARYLESQGCQVLAANWRCPAGEADLIVLDGDCIAFVEVRTRRGDAYGTPEQSITPRKLAHMAAVAETYVFQEGWQGHWRLDVVAVHVRGRSIQSIEWYRSVSL